MTNEEIDSGAADGAGQKDENGCFLQPDAAGDDPATGETSERDTAGEDPATDETSERDTAGAKQNHAKKKATKKGVAAQTDGREDEIAQLSRELESLRSEALNLKDKWLRSVAEFDNYRKRTRKEWELLQKRTKADTILGILSVVDDFERAFSIAGDRDDDFIRGIRFIYKKLTASIEEFGVRKIEALNTAFDPAYHMSVAQIEREGSEPGQVVEVVQEGYSLGDIVVRPAKVVIAK